MNRFILTGEFESSILSSSKQDDEIRVTIPFLTDDGNWLYGIGNELDMMRNLNIYPSEVGFDIITLATMVYMADTRISRTLHSQDSWTREIALNIPVYLDSIWQSQVATIERMLCFLTGDIWRIAFIKRKKILEENTHLKNDSYDRVSLFSGGMDSLISSINELEDKKNILLVSHAGDSLTKKAQKEIVSAFDINYPKTEHKRIDLWMVFERNYIPFGGSENTTRSRSFLFISSALFVMSGTKNLLNLMVPENGTIALNVPLDNLRVGSHSTRTTHPFYLKMWNSLLKNLGTEFSVSNPYWNKTKGEMADQCRNKELLYDLMTKSFSCSSPGKARWRGVKPQHCGYCVPCLIRRAAMYKAFGKDPTEYTEIDIKKLVADRDTSEGIQIRSFQYAINRIMVLCQV